MKFKNVILPFAVFLVFSKSAFCGNLEDAKKLFYTGNAKYSEEKFGEAIEDYEAILKLRLKSGPLFYNLGNAYFKEGALGKAILNYVQARRLMPEDTDLKSNLDYAESLIKNGKILPEENWFTQGFFSLANSLSLRRATLFTSILYFMLSFLIIIAIAVRQLRKILIYICAVFFVLLLVSLSIFFVQYQKEFTQNEAVVISKRADCKFEPFISATTFFTLYEGNIAAVLEEENDWAKIRRPDGKLGWIQKKDIERVN